MGGFIDMIKGYIHGNDDKSQGFEPDDGFVDDPYIDTPDGIQPIPPYDKEQVEEDEGDISNVLSLNGNTSTPIVIRKINTYMESKEAANVLKRKQIVILNLENCPHEDSQRAIDFLSGVAYANGGALKKIAGRAYLITPNNVPLTGDLEKFDPTEKNNMSFFEKNK